MIAIINIVLKYLQLNFTIFENSPPNQQKGPKLPLLDLSEKYGGSLNLSEEANEDEENGSFESRNMSSQKGNPEKEKYLEQISKKYEPLLEKNQEKREMQKLIKNCLGILYGIQQEGKKYNLAGDKFVNALKVSCGDKFG